MAESTGASSFTIKELTGELRELRLTERTLPMRGAQFSTTMRAKFSWLPGSPEASVQVFGAMDDPSGFNGTWKNRYMAASGGTAPATLNGSPVTSAAALVEVMDDICRKGQLLLVSWFRLKRVGILRNFKHIWHYVEVVDWAAEFEWSGRDTAPMPAAAIVQQSDLSDDWVNVERKVAATSDAVDACMLSVPFAVDMDKLGRQVSEIEATSNQIQATVTQLADGILAPAQAARRVRALLLTTGEDAKNLAETLERQADGAGVTVVLDAAAAFALAVTSRKAARAARDTRQEASARGTALAVRADRKLLGVYIAREGDDLRDASSAFYNTPHEWRRLLVWNNLTSAELTTGQSVEIPVLTMEG